MLKITLIDPVTDRLDWLDKPWEEWPASGKEFYRLLCVGWERHHAALAKEKEKRDDPSK